MKLERVYLSDRTLGSLYDDKGEMIAKTLELPWKNNSRSVSCIPEGKYKVIKEPPKADRPYVYFRVLNVPGRSGILIHRGVKPIHSKGCILVGSRFAEVNSNQPILESSTVKMDWLAKNLPDSFELEITKK
jgi:hypothetical protein